MIAASIANWSMGGANPPRKPGDFALSLLQDEKKPRKPRINRRKIADEIRKNFNRFKLVHG